LHGADHSFFTNHILVGGPELIKIPGALERGFVAEFAFERSPGVWNTIFFPPIAL